MKKSITILLVLISLIFLGNTSYAAIEIIPSKNNSGKDGVTNSSISNSYWLCQNMKSTGESLYGTSVLPHLATNADWGAVSYLSNSIYGTNTAGGNTGVEITIKNVKYYSTNGNATGVMNWGSNPNKTVYTQTSGIIDAYIQDPTTTPVASADDLTYLVNNKDTRYVDVFSTYTSSTTRGMAISETDGIFSSRFYAGTDRKYPVSIRNGLFGGVVGSNYNFFTASGAENQYATFRPVIWNQ